MTTEQVNQWRRHGHAKVGPFRRILVRGRLRSRSAGGDASTSALAAPQDHYFGSSTAHFGGKRFERALVDLLA